MARSYDAVHTLNFYDEEANKMNAYSARRCITLSNWLDINYETYDRLETPWELLYGRREFMDWRISLQQPI